MPRQATEFFRSLTRFNRTFWSANISELFERVAFYGMTSFLVLYLTEVRGIPESAAIRLNGNFGLVVYGLPVLSGFIADWMGFRRAILMAYALLAVGYFLTGQFTTYWSIAGALLLVAFGASLIKPCITGTTQKTSPAALGAVGFSIYYMLVNIGGSLAPNIAGVVAEAFGGPQVVFYSSTAAILFALVLIFFVFREPGDGSSEVVEKKTFRGFSRDFLVVVGNGRLMVLFLFVAGFWSMFFQFFGALPLYLRTDLGIESERLIGFVISLDAIAIVCLQVVVGYLVRNIVTVRAVLLGVAVSSLGILFMATYPSLFVVGTGVVVFALGEMTYSAHFYKYLGDMAPKDQVGMYMGFAFLPIAVGSWISGMIGGPILQLARETIGRPQVMWVLFGSVGMVSALGIALLAFVFTDTSTSTSSPKEG